MGLRFVIEGRAFHKYAAPMELGKGGGGRVSPIYRSDGAGVARMAAPVPGPTAGRRRPKYLQEPAADGRLLIRRTAERTLVIPGQMAEGEQEKMAKSALQQGCAAVMHWLGDGKDLSKSCLDITPKRVDIQIYIITCRPLRL